MRGGETETPVARESRAASLPSRPCTTPAACPRRVTSARRPHQKGTRGKQELVSPAAARTAKALLFFARGGAGESETKASVASRERRGATSARATRCWVLAVPRRGAGRVSMALPVAGKGGGAGQRRGGPDALPCCATAGGADGRSRPRSGDRVTPTVPPRTGRAGGGAVRRALDRLTSLRAGGPTSLVRVSTAHYSLYVAEGNLAQVCNSAVLPGSLRQRLGFAGRRDVPSSVLRIRFSVLLKFI